MRHSFLMFAAVLMCSVAWVQTPEPTTEPSTKPSRPDNNMSGMSHDMSNMKDMPMSSDKDDSEASAHVMHSMEGHMDMGPHMKMTALRPSKPGDAARAQQVAEAARQAAEKYK